MNKMYGFSGEITQKYSNDHYEVSQELFNEIPLAHVIFNKVFVVHGGLSTCAGFSLDMIRKEKRGREPPESGKSFVFIELDCLTLQDLWRICYGQILKWCQADRLRKEASDLVLDQTIQKSF